MFYCFWFCFNVLIAWVKAGHCPNYFILTNNMFQRKIWGLNQLKVIQILQDIRLLKWKCLSIGTVFSPTIWESLCNTAIQSRVMNPTTAELEMEFDKNAVVSSTRNTFSAGMLKIHKTLHLLSKSDSDTEECLTYYQAVIILSALATEDFPPNTDATDNKTRYKTMRKCKRWLTPSASIGTNILYMATFHFNTGNYKRSLNICAHVMSSVWHYMGDTQWSPDDIRRYLQAWCGQGYSLMYKMKNFAFHSITMRMDRMSLSHLHPEMSKIFFVRRHQCQFWLLNHSQSVLVQL